MVVSVVPVRLLAGWWLWLRCRRLGSPITIPIAIVIVQLFHLGVLFVGQDAPHAEQHQRARLAQLGPRRLDAIGGLQDLGLVGRRIGDDLRQLLFVLLERVFLRSQSR